MYAEGIPAVIQVSREVRTAAKEHHDKINEIFLKLQNMTSNITQQNDNLTQLITLDLPQRLCNILLERFQIDGATAVTMDNIRSMFAEHSSNHNQERQEQLQDILRHITNLQNTQHSAATSIPPPPVQRSSPEFGGEVHMWPGGEGFHRVPVDFRWPSDCTFAIWDLWFHGNPHLKIGPYRFIDPAHDLRQKKCKTNRAKCVRVIKALTNIAMASTDLTNIQHITTQNSQQVFDTTYRILIQQLYRTHKRPSEINIYTIANKLYN